MAGINLSQADSQTKPGFFDKGTVTGFVFLLLTLAVFGGLRWYIWDLQKQNQTLDSLLSEKKTVLEGAKIDRLADVNARISYLAENRTKESKEVLTQLEKVILPTVTLSTLGYQSEDGTISLKAETSNFKILAQQLQTIKSTGVFSAVSAGEIARGEKGGVTFSIEAEFVTPDKK